MNLESLSPSEKRVFDALLYGKGNRQIAEELCLEETTIEKHITKILQKCNARNVRHLLGKIVQGMLQESLSSQQ